SAAPASPAASRDDRPRLGLPVRLRRQQYESMAISSASGLPALTSGSTGATSTAVYTPFVPFVSRKPFDATSSSSVGSGPSMKCLLSHRGVAVQGTRGRGRVKVVPKLYGVRPRLSRVASLLRTKRRAHVYTVLERGHTHVSLPLALSRRQPAFRSVDLC